MIKSKIEELKESIKEEYGVNADIDINIHEQDNNIDYAKARKIADKLFADVGGELRHWEHETANGVRIGSRQVASICVFYPRNTIPQEAV